ncbi:MAG: type II toxin-antitoxin system RelE/ParE family toxin [Bacteroidales bacterium]
MVFYNESALDDIEEIFAGLLEWRTKDNQQPIITFGEAWNYRNDLFNTGNSLDKLTYHSNAQFEVHKRYGEFIYRYERNQRTQWYFIYKKAGNNIFINKIISNYLTIE